MAFKLKTTLANATPTTEYMEGTAGETIKRGEALVLTLGKLTKCGSTVKPQFVSLGDMSCDENSTVPVMRIMDLHIFECPITGDTSSLVAGDVVTLSTDGLGVTTTETNGVAQIINIEGKYATVKF
jgi:hypothetical protein